MDITEREDGHSPRADEGVTRHRIYAGDPSSDDASYVGDREDLEPLFIDQWRRHIAPDLYLHTISTLGDQLKEIEARLDDAVAARLGAILDRNLRISRSLLEKDTQ